MPILRAKGGFRAFAGSKKVHKTRAAAERQLAAIKARQAASKKKR